MTETPKFRAIRGTRDILPPDSARWNWFEQTAREVFESYNFGEIRLPIFEETELFARSIGADTDVIHKEMYRIESSVEIARRMIVGETKWAFMPRDSSDYRRFTATLSMFLVLSKSALESGEIRASSENTAIVAQLKDLLESALKLDPDREPLKETERQAIRSDASRLLSQFDSESISLRPEATA